MYFNSTIIADFGIGSAKLLTSGVKGVTHIFTVPLESQPRGCSGTVSAIEYCYQTASRQLGRNRASYNLLALTQEGLHFTVNASFEIRATSSNSTCSAVSSNKLFCCDVLNVTTLSDDSAFRVLPSSGLVVGVTVRTYRPLVFTDSATEFQTDQFEAVLSTGNSLPSVGSNFTLGESDVMHNSSILLMRFLIGMFPSWLMCHACKIITSL